MQALCSLHLHYIQPTVFLFHTKLAPASQQYFSLTKNQHQPSAPASRKQCMGWAEVVIVILVDLVCVCGLHKGRRWSFFLEATIYWCMYVADGWNVDFPKEQHTSTEWPIKHLIPVQQCTPTTTMKRHIQVSMQSSDFMDSSTATTNWNRFESWHLISISKQIVGVYRIQFFIYTYNRVHDPWREHQAKLNLIGMLNLGWQSAQLT